MNSSRPQDGVDGGGGGYWSEWSEIVTSAVKVMDMAYWEWGQLSGILVLDIL